MYKIILGLILLVVVAFVFYLAVPPQKKGDSGSTSSVQENFSDWVNFNPPAKQFKVSLPSTPQFFEDTVELPFSPEKGEFEMYVSTKVNGTLFMVNSVRYPPKADTSNPQEVLRALVEQLSYTRPGNRIVALKESQFDRYPALDFSLENKEFKVEGKALMVDKRAFILTYIARKGDFDSREYEHFMNSFSLLEAGNDKK